MFAAFLERAKEAVFPSERERTVTTKEGITYTVVTVRPSQRAYDKAAEKELRVALAAQTAREEAEKAYEIAARESCCCKHVSSDKKS